MATSSVQSISTPESGDEFLELEAKIHQVAAALTEARRERDQAQAALAPLQAAHEKLQLAHAQTERELKTLRQERNEIRQRILRLNRQLEEAGA
jgi:chromosome segregation ATPase